MEERSSIREKLANTNDKIDALSRILLKKAILRSGETVERSTITLTGLPVEAFRTTKWSIQAKPKPHVPTSNEVPPLPLKAGSKLEVLRHKILEKTLVKLENQYQEKLKIETQTLNDKKQRKNRKLPHIEVPASTFPHRYVRGELPCTIEHGVKGQYLSWVCPLDNLDYEYYLPQFFDGLRVKDKPCCFLARQGIEDMLYAAHGRPERIIPCFKLITRPLKHALSLFDIEILPAALKSLRQILAVDDSLGKNIF